MPNEKDTIGLSHTQMAASVRLGFSLKRFQGNRRSWPDTWVKETSNGDISIAPKMWQRLGFWEDFYDGDRQAEDIFRDERDKILGITVTGAKTPNSGARRNQPCYAWPDWGDKRRVDGYRPTPYRDHGEVPKLSTPNTVAVE
jgi:hypothetical protein